MKYCRFVMVVAFASVRCVAQEPPPNLEKIRPVDIFEVFKNQAEDIPRPMKSILESQPETKVAASSDSAPISNEDEIAMLRERVRSLEERISRIERAAGPKPVPAPIIYVPLNLNQPRQFPAIPPRDRRYFFR